MAKRNQYIDQIVAREISRLILEGKLYTKEMVDADILQNLEMWAKIWTCAINRREKIGYGRIQGINDEVDKIKEELDKNKKECNGDEVHALSVIEREYNQIMERRKKHENH